jgi:hypothetical protein
MTLIKLSYHVFLRELSNHLRHSCDLISHMTQMYLMQSFEPLFYKYGVDLAFNGHVHS